MQVPCKFHRIPKVISVWCNPERIVPKNAIRSQCMRAVAGSDRPRIAPGRGRHSEPWARSEREREHPRPGARDQTTGPPIWCAELFSITDRTRQSAETGDRAAPDGRWSQPNRAGDVVRSRVTIRGRPIASPVRTVNRRTPTRSADRTDWYNQRIRRNQTKR